jgi:hypothetical protein
MYVCACACACACVCVHAGMHARVARADYGGRSKVQGLWYCMGLAVRNKMHLGIFGRTLRSSSRATEGHFSRGVSSMTRPRLAMWMRDCVSDYSGVRFTVFPNPGASSCYLSSFITWRSCLSFVILFLIGALSTVLRASEAYAPVGVLSSK